VLVEVEDHHHQGGVLPLGAADERDLRGEVLDEAGAGGEGVLDGREVVVVAG
jgi:hypothetical protein